MPGLKILAAGAGSLGSLAGACLSREHEVTLYVREPHIAAINSAGLTISGAINETFYGIRACFSPEDLRGNHFDLVLLGVKAYDTDAMLGLLDGTITFDMIFSLQNGLKDELLISRYGVERVLGCFMDEAASMAHPGAINYRAKGITFLGPFTGDAFSQKNWKWPE